MFFPTSLSPSQERFKMGETNGEDSLLSPHDLLLNVDVLCLEKHCFKLGYVYCQYSKRLDGWVGGWDGRTDRQAEGWMDGQV